MEFISDVYVIQAADLIPLWAGRCYNLARGRWESVHGSNPTPENQPYAQGAPRFVRSLNLTIHAASGSLIPGTWATIYLVGDPVRTGDKVPLYTGVQGRLTNIYWSGRQEFLAGIEWRIHQGGLIATDYVEVSVGYER